MSATAETIVLFEDPAWEALGPIAALRPVHELRVGALNLRERLELAAPDAVLGARTTARINSSLLSPCDDPRVMTVHAGLCASVELLERLLEELEAGEALTLGGTVVLSRGEAGRRREAPAGLHLIERPWDLARLNEEMLIADALTLRDRAVMPRRIHGVEFEEASARGVWLAADRLRTGPWANSRAIWIEPDQILCGRGVDVRPGAVIDASGGPVILGAGVTVHPLSVVTGPAYLGPGTVVNPGAKLREGTSAGAFCKLGGEIEESVILDFANKQHDGFLGHAVVGSWVNLGANTTGSDLKNNYSAVRVDLGDGPVETGLNFVGQTFGDHAKTGIGTLLTTGAVVGVSANVFGAGFAPRFVPPFSWGGSGGLSEYRIEDALRTARAVYARREVRWTEEVEALLREHFAATAPVRSRHLVR